MELGPISMIALSLAGIIFGVMAIGISKIAAPTSKNASKAEPYECGIPTRGPAWAQFRIGYYIYALIFLLFEIEIVFLYPWAVVVKSIGLPALAAIIFFLTILFLALLYAWRKGVLKWM